MNQPIKQQGFSLVYLIIVLGFSGALGIAFFKPSPQALKSNLQQKQLDLLAQAKQNLLMYTINIPEIYATNTSSAYYLNNRVPSPGYLPCPDTDNDGAMDTPCGQGTDFIGGLLPLEINSRNIRFNPSNTTSIHYVVDSRYVIQNSDFNNPPTQRFAPLNNTAPGNGFLTLGSQDDVIAFIFLGTENVTDITLDASTGTFRRPTFVASITHAEWHNTLLQRITAQQAKLCLSIAGQPHWFNDYDSTSNPVGANWRSLTCP
jgi:type II secretory pathway pseudopilin PulG